jgi:hypothetical protein
MSIIREATCRSDLAPEALYHAVSQVCRWPEWDPELDSVTCDQAVATTGTRFVLKPKGGPRVRLVVEEAAPPRRFTDIAFLPLARMRTVHAFEALPEGGTRVTQRFETSGLLAWLWDRVLVRGQVAGAAAQVARMATFASRGS